MARVSTIITLRPGDPFLVRQYPVRQRPAYTLPAHVSVDLVEVDDGGAWLDVEDPTAIDGLIAALVEARDWLASEIAGQPVLPVDPEPVAAVPVGAVPVGDTGLTLHPIPVGEA